MALLLYRLGKFSYRHRWLVISLWLAVLLAVGGAAAAFRPHRAYLVGATGPGGAHAAYSLTLKAGRG